MSNGTLTKIRKADPENGVEARYRYEVEGMVYELEKGSERYVYSVGTSVIGRAGYRLCWTAERVTENGLRHVCRKSTRAFVIDYLDDMAKVHADYARRGIE